MMTNSIDMYLSLISTDSLGYFPENSSTCFTNILTKDHLFEGNFEIGLASISFNLEEKPKMEQVINLDKEDQITLRVPEVASDTVNINGSEDPVLPAETFLNTLTSAVSLLDAVKFSLSYDSLSKKFTSLIVNIANDGFVELDSNLSKILGFEQSTFTNGRHEAKKPFDEQLLQSTKAKAAIKYIKYIDKKIDIEEPSDDSLDAFCEALHKSFRKAGEDVYVTYDEVENFINFDLKKEHLEFQFPQKISDFLKINSQYMFTKKVAIQVPPTFEEHSLNHILCCTNLIDYQAYGSTEAPIIRIIDIGANSIKGRYSVSFSSIQYYPLTSKHFRAVTSTLVVKSAKYYIDLHPSTLVFHIRQK